MYPKKKAPAFETFVSTPNSKHLGEVWRVEPSKKAKKKKHVPPFRFFGEMPTPSGFTAAEAGAHADALLKNALEWLSNKGYTSPNAKLSAAHKTYIAHTQKTKKGKRLRYQLDFEPTDFFKIVNKTAVMENQPNDPAAKVEFSKTAEKESTEGRARFAKAMAATHPDLVAEGRKRYSNTSTKEKHYAQGFSCLLYTSPSPRDVEE